jgi:F-type H+-transporting ATPase subunit epsilon
MRLKVLLPFQVFADVAEVKRIVVRTGEGSVGILPHRLDFAAAIAPGILVWETAAHGEVSTAVDEGVMVKTGDEVLISVRNAIGGSDLGKLKEAVERQFVNLGAEEKVVRTALAKMETGLIRRLAEFHHD